jgi:CheY-like chemotaxis protein
MLPPIDNHGPDCAPLRVLIVEDTAERQEILTALFRDHAWVLAPTGARAIRLLQAFDFDLISLDYNLRGELSGVDVAQGILNSRNRNTRVVVHSLNPQGRARIAELLPQAIIYPVSRMVRSNRHFKRLRARLNELGAAFDWYQSAMSHTP